MAPTRNEEENTDFGMTLEQVEAFLTDAPRFQEKPLLAVGAVGGDGRLGNPQPFPSVPLNPMAGYVGLGC
jgi:hypothetical protein